MIKKIFLALLFYLNPQKIAVDFRKLLTVNSYRKKGFILFAPNYLFKPEFQKNDIAIDIGCGFEVEFSSYLIDHFGLNCFCVDPTKKHELPIQKKVEQYNGKLVYFQNALCAENCTIQFNETLDNESGSILSDHTNVLHDRLNQYAVEGIDLNTLFSKVNSKEIALLKIDIEGAEYELFDKVDERVLKKCKQIFVEFHHASVKSYKKRDTLAVVKKVKMMGFEAHTVDGLNYLFLRK